MNFHWLSFADGELPKGSQFLGVVIIKAPDFISAVTATHLLGINPGGEIQGLEFDGDAPVPEGFTERLLTRGEVLELEGIMSPH